MSSAARKLCGEVGSFLLKPTSPTAAPAEQFASMEDLPAELLLRILEFIGDDKTGVRNLSLVASPLTSACQKHLFTTVAIRPPYQPTLGATPRAGIPRAEAIALIAEHPTIRCYVQAIQILDDYTAPFKSWLRSPDLGKAMVQLSKATTITSFTFSRQVVSPPLELGVSDDLMEAITNICCSPALQCISLLNCAPLCLLELCAPSVRNVVLKEDKDLVKCSSWVCKRTGPLPLVSLSLERRTPLKDVTDYLLDPSKLMGLGELQRLYVTVSRLDESPQLSRLLSQCPAVEELVIEAGPYILPRSIEVFVNLSAQTRLQRLRVHGHLFKSSYKQLSWLVSTLATLPTPCGLKEIKLEMDVKRNREMFTNPSWGELDHLVTDKDRFPELTRFVLDVRNYEDGAMSGESRMTQIQKVIKQVQQSLPLLADRNIGSVRLVDG